MSALPGTWAVTMRTPIGSIEAEMTFVEGAGGISGTAVARGETVPLHDVATVVSDDGEHVTWRQSVTKPMRLNLVFEVVVEGDQMHGSSRAGRLPRSAVTGRRA